MKAYRIGGSQYANGLTGEGARLFGGRWNHKSIPCIYCSETRALALLEYTFNVNIEEIPRALSITTFEIPDSQTKVVLQTDLPGNWKESPAPLSTKDYGSKLLSSFSHFAYKIPSSVIADEYNFILNPLHKDSKHLKIIDRSDFVYDVRIKNT